MANNATNQPDWSQRLRFHVAQAKLSAETGNFTYFHGSRAQHIADGVDHVAIFEINQHPQETLHRLTQINISIVETCEVAITEFEREFKNTTVDEKLEEDAQKAEWFRIWGEKSDIAKNKVSKKLDPGREAAIALINILPEDIRDAATRKFMSGFDVAIDAWHFLISRLNELLLAIPEFRRKVWNPLTIACNATRNMVEMCVSWLSSGKTFEETNGIDDATAPIASQATNFLLSLLYDFRVPDDEVSASASRIWEGYRARYSQATSDQEPQNVSLSSKPQAQGPKHTDGKSMFISWQVEATGHGRELMDPVCRSEEKAMARYCSGALRHSVVDMANPSNGTQQSEGIKTHKVVAI